MSPPRNRWGFAIQNVIDFKILLCYNFFIKVLGCFIMDKIQIKKDSKILFIGDSITDVKFNFCFAYKFGGRNIYALQLKKKFKK